MISDRLPKLWIIVSLIFLNSVKFLSCKEYGCTWTDKAKNASFDLCDLRLNNESQFSWYGVKDKRATPNVSSFEYFFNVASDILQEIPIDTCYNETLRQIKGFPMGYCDDVFNYSCRGNIVNIDDMTAAYQSFVSKGSCYRLHDGVTAPLWALIDSDDPTKGVQMTYLNGDWCEGGGKNRETTLVFHCADDYSNTFDKEETIEEFEICSYGIELYTIHGCPLECPYVNERLCNGQGICDYDFSNNRSKCFCYEGYYGDDCVDTSDPNKITIYNDDDEQYVGGLIIVVILLVVMLAILTYLWLRLDRVNKGVVKTDVVKKLVSKKGSGPQLTSIDNVKDDSYDDDEQVAM